MIKYGTNNIGKIYFGSNPIGKAYLGSNLVYQKGGGGGSILPDGYKQLTYAEVPLYTQAYINTGIAASNNIGFEIDAMTYDPVGNTTYGCLFGCRAGSNQSDFQLSTYIASGSSFGGTLRVGGASQNYNAHLTRGVRFQASLNGTTFTVDGTDYTVSHNITSGKNIYLFALNNNGTAAQFGHVRVYRFKLTSGGDLVLDYVPCRRVSDGVVGFYDLVAGAFVAPTSGVLYGVDLSDTNYDSAASYIQFTGAQLINTGIGINYGGTKVEIECQVTDNYLSTQIIFGGGSETGQWFGNVSNNGGVYGCGENSGEYMSITSATRSIFTALYNSGPIRVDVTSGSSNCSKSGQTPANFPLRIGGGGSSVNQYYSSVKIWYVKVYDGETLVRDMIPVAKNNIGYFYDRITGLLFGGIGSSPLVAVTE